jgi:hypothetical protein
MLPEGMVEIILNNSTFTRADILAMPHETALNLVDQLSRGQRIEAVELGGGALAEAAAGGSSFTVALDTATGVASGALAAGEAIGESATQLGQGILDLVGGLPEKVEKTITLIPGIIKWAALAAIAVGSIYLLRKAK